MVILWSILIGTVLSSLFVWKASEAAFSGTTSNAANSWTAGTVSLTDDDSSAAMFTATGLVPSSSGSNCITVTYGGSVTSAVKLYVSASTNSAFQAYLDLVVDEGTGGGFGDCTGFSSTSTLFTGTLATFASTNVDHASGLSSWTPTAAGQARTYRFTYTVNAATPDGQQGANSTATFQWEARNT